jgi:hypothetical protein
MLLIGRVLFNYDLSAAFGPVIRIWLKCQGYIWVAVLRSHGTGAGTTANLSGLQIIGRKRFCSQNPGISGSQRRHKAAMDLPGCNGLAFKLKIARSAGIGNDHALKPQIKGGPGGGIDAHVAHGAADYYPPNLIFFKFF